MLVRFFAFLIALGLQPVVGQLCGGQVSCSGCTAMAGCSWNMGACIMSSSMLTACVAPACINLALNCPAASVALYATTAPLPVTTPPVSSVLPPLTGSASLYAAPSIYAPSVLPPVSTVYPSTSISSTLYPATLPSSTVSTPLYPSTILPAATSTIYPTTVLPAATAPIYSSTVVGGALPATTFGGSVMYNGGFGGPYWNGGYWNGGYNGGFGGGLFNYNGNPVNANIRNSIYANALTPFIPGIGATVGAFNNFNLLANGGGTLNNILYGGGGGGNPFGNFVRNNFFANSLGSIIPGLGGPLNELNQLNLLGSLFR